MLKAGSDCLRGGESEIMSYYKNRDEILYQNIFTQS